MSFSGLQHSMYEESRKIRKQIRYSFFRRPQRCTSTIGLAFTLSTPPSGIGYKTFPKIGWVHCRSISDKLTRAQSDWVGVDLLGIRRKCLFNRINLIPGSNLYPIIRSRLQLAHTYTLVFLTFWLRKTHI